MPIYSIFYICRRPKHPYLPPVVLSQLSTSDDKFDNQYSEYNPVFHNPIHSTNSDYSLVSASEEKESSKHLEAVFDDPVYTQPQKPRKSSSLSSSRKGASLLYHKKLEHTGSTEKLLDEDSGEYDQVKAPQLPPRPTIKVQHEDRYVYLSIYRC